MAQKMLDNYLIKKGITKHYFLQEPLILRHLAFFPLLVNGRRRNVDYAQLSKLDQLLKRRHPKVIETPSMINVVFISPLFFDDPPRGKAVGVNYMKCAFYHYLRGSLFFLLLAERRVFLSSLFLEAFWHEGIFKVVHTQKARSLATSVCLRLLFHVADHRKKRPLTTSTSVVLGVSIALWCRCFNGWSSLDNGTCFRSFRGLRVRLLRVLIF